MSVRITNPHPQYLHGLPGRVRVRRASPRKQLHRLHKAFPRPIPRPQEISDGSIYRKLNDQETPLPITTASPPWAYWVSEGNHTAALWGRVVLSFLITNMGSCWGAGACRKRKTLGRMLTDPKTYSPNSFLTKTLFNFSATLYWRS